MLSFGHQCSGEEEFRQQRIPTQQLQVAITNLYKYDKAACGKNIAAKQGVSVTYCDQSQEARKSEAAKRNMSADEIKN